MKITLRVAKLSLEIEGEGEAVPTLLAKSETSGTYSIDGTTYSIPKDVLKLSKLWRSGMPTRKIEKVIDLHGYGAVVTLVSCLRKSLPELFPYRGVVEQQQHSSVNGKNGGSR